MFTWSERYDSWAWAYRVAVEANNEIAMNRFECEMRDLERLKGKGWGIPRHRRTQGVENHE